MDHFSEYPILLSSEWKYVGISYPWHKFKTNLKSSSRSVEIKYIDAALYYEVDEDGDVYNISAFEPLLPNPKDYSNYLE